MYRVSRPSDPKGNAFAEDEARDLDLSRRITLAFAAHGAPRVRTQGERDEIAGELEAIAAVARQVRRA